MMNVLVRLRLYEILYISQALLNLRRLKKGKMICEVVARIVEPRRTPNDVIHFEVVFFLLA